ncbi:MAG: hypothetical protein JRC92_01055, partial [Deltaproteobacteria bacterium]|nr:hypothetical protein [Deltaproteobacteria bacterium]
MTRTSKLAVALIAFFLLTLGYASAQAVVFNNGWQDEGMRIGNGWYWNPEVVQLDDGTFRMYIEDHGLDGTVSNGTITLSSPQGIEWTYEGVAVMSNHPGVVRLPDGRWRLYFQQTDPTTGLSGIGSAVSSDGLTFETEEGLRLVSDAALEGADVRHPCVVALDEGGYRMYYDTDQYGAFIRIWSASSADGLTFTREGLNIDLTPYRSDWPEGFYAHSSKPEVLKTTDGVWRMYFCSSPLTGSFYDPIGIRLATSTDGVNWTVKTGDPEITGGIYPDGNQYSTFDCSVLVVDDGSGQVLRMWYSLFMPPDFGLVGDYSAIYSAGKAL